MLVDGAHGPGQIAVDIRRLDPTYYVGSLHERAKRSQAAPASCTSIPTSRRASASVRLPAAANKVRPERALFLQRDFDYMGTDDHRHARPADRDRVRQRAAARGWTEVMARNHEMIVKGREIVRRALSAPSPATPALERRSSMATLIPPEPASSLAAGPRHDDASRCADGQAQGGGADLALACRTSRVVRISAQLYNHLVRASVWPRCSLSPSLMSSGPGRPSNRPGR